MAGNVTVVVITHDRREELLRTLRKLAGLAEKPQVIVVDNGSGDGSAQAARTGYPAIEVIAARRNLGAVASSPARCPATPPARPPSPPRWPACPGYCGTAGRASSARRYVS